MQKMALTEVLIMEHLRYVIGTLFLLFILLFCSSVD
jgi:hypothetical protein